jgi:hypothetical protein
MHPTTYHQLGRFVVMFQHVEYALTELILLLTQGDDEATKILVHDLGYSQRVRTASSLFTRFIDLRTSRNEQDEKAKTDFYALLSELESLGKRRNELVHSRYVNWLQLGGSQGLLRTKQRRPSKSPATEPDEEGMTSESFEGDFSRLATALMLLENARLNILDLLYPDQ